MSLACDVVGWSAIGCAGARRHGVVEERIFVERMTSDRKLKASSEGSK